VVVVNEKDTYEFACNKWLAKDEADGQISRDLVAKGGKGGASDTLNLYEVVVKTGDKRSAGTDAAGWLKSCYWCPPFYSIH
jgi:hypothetical protein